MFTSPKSHQLFILVTWPRCLCCFSSSVLTLRGALTFSYFYLFRQAVTQTDRQCKWDSQRSVGIWSQASSSEGAETSPLDCFLARVGIELFFLFFCGSKIMCLLCNTNIIYEPNVRNECLQPFFIAASFHFSASCSSSILFALSLVTTRYILLLSFKYWQ